MVGCLCLEGALVWERTEVEVETAPMQEEVRAVFAFRNAGDEPVVIRRMRTDCDCTTPELKKREYAPGEAGQIELVFEIGERTGVQERRLTVTSTGQRGPATLVLRTEIPEVIRLEPGLVQWLEDEPRKKKTVVVEVYEGLEVEEIGLKPGPAWLRADLRGEPGEYRYRIELEPSEDVRRGTGEVEINVVLRGGERIKASLFVMVHGE